MDAPQTVSIPLTRGFVAIVDECDAHFADEHKWHASVEPNNRIYARSHAPGVNNKLLLLHRLIMNACEWQLVDHRNGDTLLNVRSNLRIATNSQNQMNKRKPRGLSTSRFKGVHRCHSISTPFRAMIMLNGKNKHLGLFSTEIEAALAYDKVAIEHFGEFARLNFPSVVAQETAVTQ